MTKNNNICYISACICYPKYRYKFYSLSYNDGNNQISYIEMYPYIAKIIARVSKILQIDTENDKVL